MHRRSCRAAAGCMVVTCAIAFSPVCAKASWETLAPGLEIARFKGAWPTEFGDSTVIVVRIDPGEWELMLMCVSETGDEHGRSARQWCERYGLAGAINAGMFATDHRTHVGYLKSGAHVNSRKPNKYMSVAAFEPVDPELPKFRLFDLETADLNEIQANYDRVVQNLRLIKRTRENRWSDQNRRWSEAALGEDEDGRVLFIYCRSPYSMHDLNKILLSLPIGLVCAQHLEGGPEAQMYLRVDEREYEFVGSYETGFNENDGLVHAFPVPNILGIIRR